MTLFLAYYHKNIFLSEIKELLILETTRIQRTLCPIRTPFLVSDEAFQWRIAYRWSWRQGKKTVAGHVTYQKRKKAQIEEILVDIGMANFQIKVSL